MTDQRAGDLRGKSIPVDREGRAGRHPAGLGRPQYQRPHPPHLFLEQAKSVVQLVSSEGVAAHELRQMVGLMHGRATNRTHLVDHDRHSG